MTRQVFDCGCVWDVVNAGAVSRLHVCDAHSAHAAFVGVRPPTPGGARVYVEAGDGARRLLRLPRLRKDEFHHSPTGFEWGYGGSGPAELARAILMEVYPNDEEVRHPRCYQRFKTDVVVTLPREGFTLLTPEVRAWRTLYDAAARTDARPS